MSSFFPSFTANVVHILLAAFLTVLRVSPQEELEIGLVLFSLYYPKTCGGQVPSGALVRPVFKPIHISS